MINHGWGFIKLQPTKENMSQDHWPRGEQPTWETWCNMPTIAQESIELLKFSSHWCSRSEILISLDNWLNLKMLQQILCKIQILVQRTVGFLYCLPTWKMRIKFHEEIHRKNLEIYLNRVAMNTNQGKT